MYSAQIAALSGELFGKNRIRILGTSVVAPAAWLVVKEYVHGWPNVAAASAALGFVLVAILALQLGAIFCYVDLTAGAKSTGFPKHICVLPVATWLLALVPIATGSMFITAFVLLWLRFISDLHLTGSGQLSIACAISSLLCWMQAMSWELIQQRLPRIAVLTVILIVVVLSLVSLMADEGNYVFGRIGGAAGLVSTMVCGCAVAYLAVIRSRRGDSADLGTWFRRLWFRAPAVFRSAQLPVLGDAVKAQNWYEWTVFGRFLPWCMVFFSIPVLLMLSSTKIRRLPSIIELGLMMAMFFLFAPLVGGAYASKSLEVTRIHIGPGSLFAALPLSDLELALAKLKLSVKSHLLSTAIVVAVLVTILLTSRNNVFVFDQWGRLHAFQGSVGSLLSVFLLSGFVIGMPWAAGMYLMALSFTFAIVNWKKHGWWIVLGILALIALAVKLGVVIYQSRQGLLEWFESVRLVVLVPPVFAITLCLCLLGVVRDSLQLDPLKKVAAGYLGLLIVCLTAVWQLDLSVGYRWALLWLVVTLVLTAFLPFLLIPLLVGFHRHR
jgi:hypothetical protein